MSEYKGIKGFQVQTRTEDPTPYAQALADNPYAGSWASGSALNTGRTQFGGSGASYNSALGFGGDNGSTQVNNTESYNGSSWTEVNDLNTARSGNTGFGTQTAAFAVAGFGSSTLQATVESWDGSSWTETTDINTARRKLSSAGVTTSGIVYGGQPDSGGGQAQSESWNGSAWTETSDLNTARGYGGRLGVSNTSALMGGGDSRPPSNSGTIHAQTETWNGSAWTEVNDLNTARGGLGGSGTLTDGIVYGGQTPPNLTNTEAWDGTSWTEVNDLATARARLAETSQSGTSALGFGGEIPPGGVTTATEEWQFSGLPPSTPAANYSNAIIGDFYYNSTTGQFKNTSDGISAGTWGSGGNMNTARYRMFGGFSPHTEGLVAGGQAPTKANVENYNGTSWTEVADIPSARSDSGMIGVYTAGVLAGGGPPITNEALHWNGSAWTEATDIPISVERASGSGVQTAGMVTGGRNPGGSAIATNLEYDGTNWTSGGNLPVATYNITVQGPQTSAIAAGGVKTGEGSGTTAAYTYDGSSWTAVSSLNTATYESGWSTQGDGATRALIFGGNDAPARPTTQFWDGTSWTELNDLSTGRSAGGSFGGVNNSVYAGGTPPTTAATEEWSASDFVNKTVTTS